MMTELPVTPSFSLEGRRALVTGGGRGIGAAAGAALAQAGAHVTLVARSHREIEEVAQAIRAKGGPGGKGGKAEALPLDVNDIEAVAAALHESEPFDILVNSAGTNRPASLVNVTPDDFDAVMKLNVRASFFVTQFVVRGLIAAGRAGSIIQVSSQMGHVGGANRTVYCASKWAMEGFTRAMAVELAPHNIRVNTLCPTFIETAMTKPFFENEKFRTEVLAKIKLGRLGKVEDLMGAVVFLASDASALMTGTSIVVDGGWTAD